MAIEEGLKTNLITSTTEISRISMKEVLNGLSSLKFSFDETMDVLLRGLGRDLVKELVSPGLIAELWGFSALEKFNKTVQE